MYRSNFPDKAFIDNLLLRCSVPPQTQGFDFLSEAIYLYATGHYKNISEIYAEIGAKRGYPESKVHRYADYSLNQAFNLADTVNELFGTRYAFNDLHNKLVVALFAHYLIIHRAEQSKNNKEEANKDK